MAVCTKQHAFFYLCFYPVPGGDVPIHGHSKVFLARISVMKFQGVYAPIVAALLAGSAEMRHGHSFQLSPTLGNSFRDCRLALLRSLLWRPAFHGAMLIPWIFWAKLSTAAANDLLDFHVILPVFPGVSTLQELCGYARP